MYNINLLSVLVAGAASMAVGFIWYGPLFGKVWRAASGMTPEKMEEQKKKGMGKTFSLAFVSAVVTAYVLAVFINRLGIGSLVGGLKVGFAAWLGFTATVKFTDTLFGGKSWKLFLIDAGHYLAATLSAAAILTLWK